MLNAVVVAEDAGCWTPDAVPPPLRMTGKRKNAAKVVLMAEYAIQILLQNTCQSAIGKPV
jgi:hypothetical protein